MIGFSVQAIGGRLDGPRLGRRHDQAVGMQIAGVTCYRGANL